MTISRRAFLAGASAFSIMEGLASAASNARIFAPNGGRAADFLVCRRLYLDICGRIPTPEEVDEYVASRNPRKCENLVDRLLESDDFADYYAMRYCDFLRVKSEFPINLWPNAVYVYHRWIRETIRRDMPWTELAKCSNLYSIIRSMTHPFFGHETATYLMQTGRNPGGGITYPALGALISSSRVKGPGKGNSVQKDPLYEGDLPPFREGTPVAFCGVVFGSQPPETATVVVPQKGPRGFFLGVEPIEKGGIGRILESDLPGRRPHRRVRPRSPWRVQAARPQ